MKQLTTSRLPLMVVEPVRPARDRPRSKNRQSPADPFVVSLTGLFNRAALGLIVLLLLAAGIGGWGATAELSGAVLAPGSFVVEESSKKVQHPTGGVIKEIRVRNGQRVEAGEVLVGLDNTEARAAHEVTVSKLIQLRGEHARLVAERDGSDLPTPNAATVDRSSWSRTVADRQRGLLEAQRNLTGTQKQRLRQRIELVRREIAAIGVQRDAKAREIALIRRELQMVEDLNSRQLSNMTRLIDVQRQLARFEGEHASLGANQARVEGQIHEIELQIVEIDKRGIVDAYRDMREIEVRIEELMEREKVVWDQVVRTELRAPVTGVVHELTVHTIGGVIRPGETVMLIVPDGSAPTIEARLKPDDIDHVAVGRRAVLRLTALDRRTTPELSGTVVHVGADLSRDPVSGRNYYSARVAIDSGEAGRLGTSRLVPGMPVEVFIETAPRTALSYLLRPLRDNLARSMREP